MSVNYLPNEILQLVFKNLNGRDLLACCKVSDRWQYLVESLGEKFWKGIVVTEHRDIYKDAYNKAKLSWLELYLSLALWSDVATADIKIYQAPARKTNVFQILKDSVIACPEKKMCTIPKDWFKFDMITHHDLTTLEVVHKECFDFTFTYNSYAENDNFVVLKYVNNLNRKTLCILIKPIDKRFYFEEDSSISSVMLDNEIYYQSHNKFCRLKFDEKTCDVSVENLDNSFGDDNEELPAMWLVDVVKLNHDQANVLTWSDTVLSLIDNKMKLINQIKHFDNKLMELKKHGFKWGFPYIHDYLDTGRFTKFYLDSKVITAALVYGKIVIIATSRKPRTLHIYYNPYKDNGELDIHNCAPVRSIDLEPYKIESDQVRHTHINQIDAIETVNGHKLVVLYCYRIFVIELNHTIQET